MTGGEFLIRAGLAPAWACRGAKAGDGTTGGADAGDGTSGGAKAGDGTSGGAEAGDGTSGGAEAGDGTGGGVEAGDGSAAAATLGSAPRAAPGGSATLYLAQHPLLEQVPSLGADVGTPDACSLTRAPHDAPAPAPRRNVWIGPGGTVSDLHSDPEENVLCQVAGWKRVLLLPPEAAAALAPRGGLMRNTPDADPEAEATRARLVAVGHEVLEAVLAPGEGLFLPRGWLHHVRALTPSASVSFWWT